jgi:hypothetical protein
MDVYDAAELSCVVELSAKSVLGGSMSVSFPDFTRRRSGKFQKLEFFQ